MPDPGIQALERDAARHWQAPDTEPLGEWLLRAAGGFTGRANSALPQGAAPDHLETHLNERGWLPRSGPAFVMVVDAADLPLSRTDVFRCGFQDSHRYHYMMAPS